MTVNVAGIGHQSHLLQMLQKLAPDEDKTPAGTSPETSSPVPTSSAQNLTALASFMTEIGRDGALERSECRRGERPPLEGHRRQCGRNLGHRQYARRQRRLSGDQTVC